MPTLKQIRKIEIVWTDGSKTTLSSKKQIAEWLTRVIKDNAVVRLVEF